MIEEALVIIQAEQKRSDELAALRVAKSADNAIRCADALHFQHSAFTEAVIKIYPLCDHTVCAGKPGLEPALRSFEACGLLRQGDPLIRKFYGDLAKSCAALLKRRLAYVFTIRAQQRVKRSKGRRRLTGQFCNSTLGRMEAHLQRVER